jgi:hypothetical protein
MHGQRHRAAVTVFLQHMLPTAVMPAHLFCQVKRCPGSNTVISQTAGGTASEWD